jgi:hypothetical protein
MIRFDSNDLSLLQSSKEDIMEAVLAMRSTWNPSTPLRIITISSSSNSSLATLDDHFSSLQRKMAGNKKKWRGKLKKNGGKTEK